MAKPILVVRTQSMQKQADVSKNKSALEKLIDNEYHILIICDPLIDACYAIETINPEKAGEPSVERINKLIELISK